MLIERFEVKGYKNFQSPVCLEALGGLNVIHGPNNVGKSNLLQSIALFFYLLTPKDGESKPLPIAQAEVFSSDDLSAMGFSPQRIFHVEDPRPIELVAKLETDPGELRSLGIRELLPSGSVEIGIRLERILDRLEVRITRFKFADGRDLAARSGEASTGEERAYALRFALFLTRNFLVQTRSAGDRFALIGLDRRIHPGVQASSSGADYAGGVVPTTLMLELYDAKESIEPQVYRRWELFTDVMQQFSDVLGPGRFLATFDRTTGKALLVFETPRARLPVDLLGAGIQQVVSIVGRLLMTKATIIGIEEPELNLRFDAQLRLREIFARIAQETYGPRQIFLTSHSPAFEHGEWFYGMVPTESGPRIDRRRGAEAELFTRHTSSLSALVPRGDAAMGYVSSDGLVRIPDVVRHALGLDHGGGIVIWKRDGAPYHELLTDEQFMNDLKGSPDADIE